MAEVGIFLVAEATLCMCGQWQEAKNKPHNIGLDQCELMFSLVKYTYLHVEMWEWGSDRFPYSVS